MAGLKLKPIIQYENTVSGIFVRRINRFAAEVLVEGETETVHVKNTGRLQELLVPKAKVTLQRTDNPDRKTAYDLISVHRPRMEWVNIDSLAPNELMKQRIMSLNYDIVRPEYSYGQSRFDFYILPGFVFADSQLEAFSKITIGLLLVHIGTSIKAGEFQHLPVSCRAGFEWV